MADNPELKTQKLISNFNRKFGLNETTLRGILDNASAGSTGLNGEYNIEAVIEADGTQTLKITDWDYEPQKPIYGVSGLYDEAVTLTRTDDAVDMTFAINSSTGQITSDFDNVFPYNQMTRETDDLGNVFVNIPSMWFRITYDSTSTITDIAVSETQGEVRSNIPEGSTEKWYQTKPFKYGAYSGYVDNGVLKSVSGVAVTYNVSRDEVRTYAQANGDKYCGKDQYTSTILRFLWMIEYANKNSRAIMVGRSVGGSPPANNTTGVTDSLGFATGWSTRGDGTNYSIRAMIWHNIEDYIGGGLDFEDGIITSNGQYYIAQDKANYGNEDVLLGYSFLDYGVSTSFHQETVSLGWDDNNPFIVVPNRAIEVSSNNYTTYFASRCTFSIKANNSLGTGSYTNDSYSGINAFRDYAKSWMTKGRLIKEA